MDATITANPAASTFRTTAGASTLKESCLLTLDWLALDPTSNTPVNLEEYKHLFSNNYPHCSIQKSALQLFAQKIPEERAALPIYDNACNEYLQVIEPGVREVCKAEGLTENSRWNNFDSIKLRENNGRIYVNLLRLSQQAESALTREELSRLAFHGADGMIENSWTLDLSGQNLSGLDLSSLNLSACVFAGADMRNVTINTNNALHVMNFVGADLSGAKFFKVCISESNFSGANLTNAQFIKCLMEGNKFDSATKLKWVNLSGSHIAGISWEGIDVRGVITDDPGLAALVDSQEQAWVAYQHLSNGQQDRGSVFSELPRELVQVIGNNML